MLAGVRATPAHNATTPLGKPLSLDGRIPRRGATALWAVGGEPGAPLGARAGVRATPHPATPLTHVAPPRRERDALSAPGGGAAVQGNHLR